MHGNSSSVEPLSSDYDEMRQRSALEKQQTIVDKDEKNSKFIPKGNKREQRHEQKRLYEIHQIQNSELVDKAIIISSLIFYLILFIASRFVSLKFKKFYKLSYKYEDSDYYDIGFDDLYFGIFWIINLLFLRSFLILFCFNPCAKLLGIKKFKATQRFIEQAWSMVYYSFSWGFGFYLYYNSDYYLDCYNIYANWPHDVLSAPMKFYYLLQSASWFQQFIVLHIESRRKDHYQMLAHHIITCILTTASYSLYFTKIGHVILLLMDIVDVFLSTAKILKYAGFQTVCDLMFLFFMVSWIIFRHGVYNYVLWFTATRARDIMGNKCSTFLPSETYKACYTDLQVDIFMLLLVALQVIMCIWMYMIFRVAFHVISGGSADDVRSDTDD